MKYFFLFLLLSFLCFGDLTAQVGINNPNPSQALDVAGKIKVGDDEITPVAGTIRYNRVTRTFEGFDGTEWSVFNPEADGGGGNVPASGSVVTAAISVNECCFHTVSWNVINSFDFFDEIPAGRTLYITSITVTPNGFYDFNFNSRSSSGGILNYQNYKSNAGDQVLHMSDANGHLLIVESGGHLELSNQFQSGAIVNLRGFLQ